MNTFNKGLLANKRIIYGPIWIFLLLTSLATLTGSAAASESAAPQGANKSMPTTGSPSASKPPPVVKYDSIVAYDMPLANETVSMLRLTPNRSKIIHMDKDVASVKVNDPSLLFVLVNGSRQFNVLAKDKKGFAFYTAYDKQGRVVEERYVLGGTRG